MCVTYYNVEYFFFTETLRKYPVLPFLDRKCVSDYKILDPSGRGKVTLPAGTAVYIPVMAIQNDPKYFPEPQKFDPERFTEEKKQSRPSYTYFPFGEGPRVCIGKNKYADTNRLFNFQIIKIRLSAQQCSLSCNIADHLVTAH